MFLNKLEILIDNLINQVFYWFTRIHFLYIFLIFSQHFLLILNYEN